MLDTLAACGPGAAVEELARRLAHRAQELSLDNEIDSPFAILAKVTLTLTLTPTLTLTLTPP